MLHYIFKLKNEDGMKIATSYDTNEYLSFQIGAKEVITGEKEPRLEWLVREYWFNYNAQNNFNHRSSYGC